MIIIDNKIQDTPVIDGHCIILNSTELPNGIIVQVIGEDMIAIDMNPRVDKPNWYFFLSCGHEWQEVQVEELTDEQKYKLRNSPMSGHSTSPLRNLECCPKVKYEDESYYIVEALEEKL